MHSWFAKSEFVSFTCYHAIVYLPSNLSLIPRPQYIWHGNETILISSPLTVMLACWLSTLDPGSTVLVATHRYLPLSLVAVGLIARVLVTWGGLVWLSTDDWMCTREDVCTTLPFRVQVMVAGGTLPLCMQNSNSVSPSVTVWLSGLVEKEFSNTKRERQREIHDQV